MNANKTINSKRALKQAVAATVRANSKPVFELLEGRTMYSAGGLDSSFGVGGKVTEAYNGNSNQASAVAIDMQNRIYSVGTETDANNVEQFEAMRYLPNGTLDKSFGINGIIDGGTGADHESTACAVDSRGLVIVGTAYNDGGTPSNFFITRLQEDGFYDRNFGDYGLKDVDFTSSADGSSQKDGAKCVTIDSTGNYVVGGFTNDISADLQRPAIARLDGNGNIINQFTLSLDKDSYISGIAIDSTGQIVVVGQYGSDNKSQLFVSRFDTSGNLDKTFNGSGTKYFDIGPNGIGNAIKLLANNHIVVAGTSDTGGFVADLQSNGNVTAQNSFALDGKGHIVNSLAVRADGKVLTAGYSFDNDTEEADFEAEQFNSNLTFDTSFGTASGSGRHAVVPFGGDFFESGSLGMAVDGDGRAVLAGILAGNDNTGGLERLQTNQSPYLNHTGASGETIEAENFDFGGEGVAYHDTTPLNTGGAYRASGVDITSNAQNAYVSNFSAGEWVEYTVNVPAGNYNLQYNYSSSTTTTRDLQISSNGTTLANVSYATTPGNQFSTATVPITLKAGQQVLRLAVTGGSMNLNWFKLNLVPVTHVTGTLWQDNNVNGVIDSGETKLAGKTVFIDANKNGKLDTGEKTAVTSSTGLYTLTGLTAGNYRVEYLPATGTRLTTPTTNYYDLALAAGQQISGKNFGVTTTSKISGTVFNDANGNQLQDAGEKGIAGWRVFIDKNNNGNWDAGEVSALTNTTGGWTFDTLPTGTYHIRTIAKTGYAGTTPVSGVLNFTLAAGKTIAGQLFGEQTIA